MGIYEGRLTDYDLGGTAEVGARKGRGEREGLRERERGGRAGGRFEQEHEHDYEGEDGAAGDREVAPPTVGSSVVGAGIA